ncbi:uroporphyrinogen decarboxylase family protein [Parasporobacterium paucivorans]|uniref:Uroporphyrinogen decarboxylase (URO-D) n=1 Tax=Parasporobacterium paucivorans DSM 15970 TaxID=1122934 RepID=A0A1M6GTJ6_9FIRM|nr:uroporphyrinogen decarboxylase family protein [Parasporobacterium paucivorans]SHJ13230.1 Uroporphyrinogen decarboxylase (URO-D) [Parasporobacterium paucivorans DSM 15970]
MSEINVNETASSSWFVKDLNTEGMEKNAEELFNERIQRVEDAVALKESDRIPIAPMIGALPFFLDNCTYKDTMYNYPRAGEALIKFYNDFKPDATTHLAFTSGRSNEIAQSKMIDWPGRPGTRVPDFSTYQVKEYEYMTQDEYPELLKDYTGFMLRKYIPRAFPALQGLSDVRIVPSIILNTTPMGSLYSPAAQEAFSLLAQIGKEDGLAAEASNAVTNQLVSMGFPPFMTGAGEVPFDILGDYFRGTLAALTDQLECPDEMEAACYMLADIQIASYEYFKHVPLPVKRVFFPMHKGMDGFMSDKMYERLYWKPLKKIILALVDMGVTPVLYTEGKYFTRIQQLADLPKGKVIIHFEQTDMVEAKKVLGDIACISGNLPIYLLEYGTKQQVIDECKRIIDICAPGGGYIFDTDGSIDNAKRENVEAMFDTVMTYGKNR